MFINFCGTSPSAQFALRERKFRYSVVVVKPPIQYPIWASVGEAGYKWKRGRVTGKPIPADDFVLLAKKVAILEYQMNGNGDPGICERVAFIYDYVKDQKGKEAGVQATTDKYQKEKRNFRDWATLIFLALATLAAVFSGYTAWHESHRPLGTENSPAYTGTRSNP